MNREFLYELLETASVSGFEEEIQRKVIKYARGFADEVYTDEIADVVSIVNPDAKIKVMLSAHMDEIGLMVSHITEKGMLHVSKAGGIYEGGILVKMIACGICGSDLRTYGGGSSSAIYPSISGHEIAGEIVESHIEDFPKGKKISVAPVIACGECWYCKNGMQNQCDNLKMIGTANGVPGGFAEYVSFTGDMVKHGCFNLIPEDFDPVATVIAETASSVLNAQINIDLVMEDLVATILGWAIQV